MIAFVKCVAHRSKLSCNLRIHEGNELMDKLLQALSGVQSAIDKGGFWQQLGAITLLRLTPVAPFRFPRSPSHGMHARVLLLWQQFGTV